MLISSSDSLVSSCRKLNSGGTYLNEIILLNYLGTLVPNFAVFFYFLQLSMESKTFSDSISTSMNGLLPVSSAAP